MKRTIPILIVITIITAFSVHAQEKKLKMEPQNMRGVVNRTPSSVQLDPIQIVPKKKIYTETVIQEESILPEISVKDFPGFEKTISVDLRGMSVSDVLKFLAVEGDLNIAIAPDVTGVVNLLINDVTIRDNL